MNEDKATRYHRLKRRARLLSVGWTAATLALLIAIDGGRALRDVAESAAATLVAPIWIPPATLVIFTSALVLIWEACRLPLTFYHGYLLERRYGLSSERLSTWLATTIKGIVSALVLGIAGAAVIYLSIAVDPTFWWLVAGATFTILRLGLAAGVPVLLVPTWRVKPVEREPLRTRLLSLSERAGAGALGVYEWRSGARRRRANAAVVGLGATRRILISDTVLREYPDDEVEVVLAHELAHHVHGDIWKSLAFESAALVAALYAGARVLAPSVAYLDLRSPGDLAGLPLLALVVGAVSALLGPVGRALSRREERRADGLALALTGNPAAFVSAIRRLAAQNLAENDPPRMVQWLLQSHPPVSARIAAAQAAADLASRSRTDPASAIDGEEWKKAASGRDPVVHRRRRRNERKRPVAVQQPQVLRDMPLFPGGQDGIEDRVDG
jgi:STE24 endopeptidase